jgi:arsenate reductase
VGERFFWPIDDPAAVERDDEERLTAFRRVRNEIDERLARWLEIVGTKV